MSERVEHERSPAGDRRTGAATPSTATESVRIQPKPKVRSTSDPAEREADVVASAVVSALHTPATALPADASSGGGRAVRAGHHHDVDGTGSNSPAGPAGRVQRRADAVGGALRQVAPRVQRRLSVDTIDDGDEFLTEFGSLPVPKHWGFTPAEADIYQRWIRDDAARRFATKDELRDAVRDEFRRIPTPVGYVVANESSDDATATVISASTWTSSTGELDDLQQVMTREVIDFGEDPRDKVPGYDTLLKMDPKFQINGNVLTKGPDAMGSGHASDKHSGAGYGTKFTLGGGVANLKPGEWTLTGRQHYEYQQPGGPWKPLPGVFTVTRTMVRNGDHYELSQTKTGPGVNLAAGPATIEFETRHAMERLTEARPSQDSDWDRDSAKLSGAGLRLNTLENSRVTVGATGQVIDLWYREFQAGGAVDPSLKGPGGGPFIPPGSVSPSELKVLWKQARAAVDTIVTKALGPGGHAPPPKIEFYFYPEGAGGVRQQSYYTTAGGGSYKVLLKGKDAANPFGPGQSGALAGNLKTSMPGDIASGGWTAAGKLERFCKATAIHELAHMLHALNDPEVFLQSTIMPGPGNPIQPDNPLHPESVHVAGVNETVLEALNANLGGDSKWGYAKANPAEVVAEGFTAMMAGKSVPRPIAAVYIAYGGPRSATIDAMLAKAFPNGVIPGISQPEGAVGHM